MSLVKVCGKKCKINLRNFPTKVLLFKFILLSRDSFTKTDCRNISSRDCINNI